jgi:uncharacterized membrane protein YfcA
MQALLLGMYAGHHLHTRIDHKRFNQVISLLLMVGGIMLTIKASAALFE